MQEMQRPDGSMLSEIFTGEQVQNGGAERRRTLLEQLGYRFVSLKPVSENKYEPHQGQQRDRAPGEADAQGAEADRAGVTELKPRDGLSRAAGTECIARRTETR